MLVKTLNWKVVDHMIVGLSSFQKKQLFGSGKLKMLEEKIASDMKITSIFISLYQLTVTQRLELEKTFSVPVIDRFLENTQTVITFFGIYHSLFLSFITILL